MSNRVDFGNLKAYHMAWKNKMRNFLNGTEDVDPAELVSHQNSRLGIWYYNEGKDEFGHLEPMKTFEIKQIKLHKLAKDIYELKQIGEIPLAEDIYLDLEATSQSIVALLKEAENILNQGIAAEEERMENSNLVVPWDKTKKLVSETDAKGIITYVNETLTLVSGYTEAELINHGHNILRHPDMPKVIFKILWQSISDLKPVPVIVKNRAKSGRFYWLLSNYKLTLDENSQVKVITGVQTGVSKNIVENHIEPLYAKLLSIEKATDMEASERYLRGFLTERNRSYEEFIENLLMTGRDTVKSDKKGFWSSLFGRD